MSINGTVPQVAADSSAPPQVAAAFETVFSSPAPAPAAESGTAPQPAAPCGNVPQGGASLSVAEAARELSIPERTLRAWIAEGRVETFRPDPTRRGMRIRRGVLEDVRQHAVTSGILPQPAADSGSVPHP